MKLSITQKRWLLTIHILFAAIMFGNMVTFIILSITVATAENIGLIESCYQIMHLLAKTSIRASTIGTILTGILLSVLTKWGLFKFYWIIAKEVLTLIVLGLNMWGIYYWTMQALDQISNSADRTAIYMLQIDLWAGVIIQIIALVLMFALSVFKPWGQTAYYKATLQRG